MLIHYKKLLNVKNLKIKDMFQLMNLKKTEEYKYFCKILKFLKLIINTKNKNKKLLLLN